MHKRSFPAILSLLSSLLAAPALGGPLIDTTFGDCLRAELAAAAYGGNSFYASPEASRLLAPFRARYRVQVEGLSEILARGNEKILILGNHPSITEPFVTLDALGRTPLSPSPVMAEDIFKIPVVGPKLRPYAERIGAVLVPGAG